VVQEGGVAVGCAEGGEGAGEFGDGGWAEGWLLSGWGGGGGEVERWKRGVLGLGQEGVLAGWLMLMLMLI